ncbi:MAG: hypothetical protein DRP83_06215, partial [Planctomycetota bacterium]
MRRKHIFGGIFGGGSPGRRGSVLLMVIGLLTILALLGSTFLFVARSYRKTSEALTYRYQATPLASGSLTRVVQLLKEDLRIDPTNGPYGATSATPANAWKQFIDYPAASTSATDLESDDWLASLDPVGTSWPHITNMFDYDATGMNNVSTTSNTLADSDGDGIADAYYAPSTSSYMAKVMNELGEKYYVGVRVIDLGGLINVNTACGTDAALGAQPVYSSPVLMDIYNFIGSTLYTRPPTPDPPGPGLNRERYNAAAATPDDINTNIALRLLSPTTNYNPFAIGDEMYLRYLGTDGLTDTGRLFEAGPLAPNFRRYLTTFNCSRIRVRHPEANSDPLLDFRIQTELKSASSTDAEVYASILRMLTKLPVGKNDGARQRMATHYVANLKAYEANGSTGWPWSFTCPDIGTYTAYGVVPQPVITEAFAKFTKSTVTEPPPPHDDKWVAAVEVFVPTNAVTTGLTFKLAGQTISLPTAGNRKVYWNYGGAYATPAEAQVDLPDYDASWVLISDPNLSFYGGKTVKLEATNGT